MQKKDRNIKKSNVAKKTTTTMFLLSLIGQIQQQQLVAFVSFVDS